MDSMAKGAAFLISQQLNNIQEELDIRLNSTPASCLLHEEIQALCDSIRELREQLAQINEMS
ncbi:MAG: hypothetical protein GXY50_04180 [Syntrophomonadaceae bacterium]|nr:hypothetical protein [Syntrophomonadaceae bacterium]